MENDENHNKSDGSTDLSLASSCQSTRNDSRTFPDGDTPLTQLCSSGVHGGWVYFISGDDAIKIGYSVDPMKRLKELQVGSSYPLSLLGAIEGTKETEAILHEHFRDIKKIGEWFYTDPDLIAFIDHATGKAIVQEHDPVPPRSPPSAEATALIGLRAVRGHNTRAGHICSNILEQLENLEKAADPDQIALLKANIKIQTDDLAKLLAA